MRNIALFMGPLALTDRYAFCAVPIDIGSLAGSNLFHHQGLGGGHQDRRQRTSVPILIGRECRNRSTIGTGSVA
jgi:hypothetical protein